MQNIGKQKDGLKISDLGNKYSDLQCKSKLKLTNESPDFDYSKDIFLEICDTYDTVFQMCAIIGAIC